MLPNPTKPVEGSRERVMSRCAYPVCLNPVAAAALLLQLNLLIDADLIDWKTWRAVVDLLALKDLADPTYI